MFTVGESSKDIDADLAERMSAMKRPGESDMDFYERRYQERVGIIYITSLLVYLCYLPSASVCQSVSLTVCHKIVFTLGL